jgi:hypothetical protein
LAKKTQRQWWSDSLRNGVVFSKSGGAHSRQCALHRAFPCSNSYPSAPLDFSSSFPHGSTGMGCCRRRRCARAHTVLGTSPDLGPWGRKMTGGLFFHQSLGGCLQTNCTAGTPTWTDRWAFSSPCQQIQSIIGGSDRR